MTQQASLLNPAQRKTLKALAHALNPVVMIGDKGLTPAVIKEIDQALEAHQLIKIRVFGDDRAFRLALLQEISDLTISAPIQHIGKLLVFYRANPKKPNLLSGKVLPVVGAKTTKAGPGSVERPKRSASSPTKGPSSFAARTARSKPRADDRTGSSTPAARPRRRPA